MPSTVLSIVTLLISSNDLTVSYFGDFSPAVILSLQDSLFVFPFSSAAQPARFAAAQLGLRSWPSHHSPKDNELKNSSQGDKLIYQKNSSQHDKLNYELSSSNDALNSIAYFKMMSCKAHHKMKS